MMVSFNPVSNVRFRGLEQNEINDFLSRPGAYSYPAAAPAAVQPASKKSHSFVKGLFKLVLTAAALAAAAVAAHKYMPSVFKLEKTEGLEGWKKYAEYVTTPIAQFGKYVSDNCAALWNKISKKG